VIYDTSKILGQISDFFILLQNVALLSPMDGWIDDGRRDGWIDGGWMDR